VSLRLRLIIPIGLGLFAILALGGTFAFWDARRQVQAEMRSAIAVGERIAQTAVDDLTAGRDWNQQLERRIKEFDGNRHLQAFLIGQHNDLALASKLEPPSTHVPEWFRRLLDQGPQTTQINLPAKFNGYKAIVLATNSANEMAEKWGDIVLALALLITFCAFVLALVYLTLARSLRPLLDLQEAFARVGSGCHSSQIAEDGAMELKHLAHGFNQMVARLSSMKLENARLNQQLANVQEEERADLARELHDEIGPFLFAASLDIAAIHQVVNAHKKISEQLAPRLEAIRAAIAHMQKHHKAILGRLRPAVLLDLGLSQALENLLDFWRARHSEVAFGLEVCSESFGADLDEAIYSIIRESLSNALRHGHPREIALSIDTEGDDMVVITVADDGGGMRPTNPAGPGVGFGIIGMQERVARVGGTLSVANRHDGNGVIVSARLPLGTLRNAPASQLEEAASK
jgi:two-component system, NarL family, sensor histidine kinase UhpB